MKKRSFYVALGVPRGADPDAIQVAYRKIVTRYRQAIEFEEKSSPSPESGLSFGVCRTYSERRHSGLFDQGDAIDLKGETAIDRFFGGVIPEVVTPKAKRSGKDLFVELRLSVAEAKKGGLFPVNIPVIRSCPRCPEISENDRLACTLCHGAGRITENRTVNVVAPPRVEHGTRTTIPMEDVGMDHTELLVSVLIDPEPSPR